MAKTKGTPISLTGDDFEGKKGKTIPGGKYYVRITPKSAMRTARSSGNNNANLVLVVTKGAHKGHTVYDTIGASVGWKIAQYLNALGIPKKKAPKFLEDFIKLVTNKELRVVLGIDTWNEQKRNVVVQALPLAENEDDDIDEDEDDDEEDSDEDDDSDDEDDEDEDEDEDEDDDEDEDEEDEDEDDDDDEEEDEDDEDEDEDGDDDEDEDDEDDEEDEEDDDEPAPRRRTVAKKAPAKKAAAKKAPAKKAAAKKRGR